jgi:hypothetical protein
MSAPSSRLLLSLILSTAIAAPIAVRAAPESGGALSRLNQALKSDQAEALRLVWTSSVPGSGAYRRLRIESGKAGLERCQADCQPVGTPLVLTSGERAQLISRLRGAELGSLRDSDQEADRQLEIAVSGAAVGKWAVARAEWPTPPDGYGAADFLDDLGKRIEKGASARPPVAVPRSAAELGSLRLKLYLQPRTRPGGLVIIEAGKLQVTPEEGSLPRTPRPRSFQRPLNSDEQDKLVANLEAARLDELDGLVEKRGQPAIGDDDGRLATLHLLPSDAISLRQQATRQPRGYERYLADLSRSPAAPLLNQLVGFLVTESAATIAVRPRG